MMQRLRNMKISRKLTAGFSLVSAIAVLLAVLGLVGMANAQTTEETMQARMNSMPVTAKVMTNLSQMQSACSFAVLNSSDAQTFQQSSDKLNQYQKLYEENYAELLTLRTADKWKKEIETAQNSYKNDYLPNVEQAMQLAQSGKTADAAAALQSAQKAEEQMMKTYDGLMAYRMQVSQNGYDSEQSSAAVLRTLLVILSAVGICISVLVGLRISRSISRPIAELERCAVQFSKGRLNVNVDYQSENEIGVLSASLNKAFRSLRTVISEVSEILNDIANGKCDYETLREYDGDFQPISESVNTILNNLNRIFSSILNSAAQVDSGSRQVSDGAQELAQGATEQASSVEQLSASITDVSDKVRENTQQIRVMADDVHEATQQAGQSGDNMQLLLTAMKEIQTASDEIGKINKAIDDIAFQTNILALNAAVEAARAGEAGKGFAVVADEVRSLAGKSADAAKQTTALIENAEQKVKEGLLLADKTSGVLSTIIQNVQSMDGLVDSVQKASDSQSSAISQITEGLNQVSAVVQNNSATAEESAAASEELSAQADLLKKEIDWIKIRNGSGSAEPAE